MDPSVAAAPPMKIVFSIEDHIKGWRKAREFTATGPSGLTFSHFIAATYDPLLASFDATMANIQYATGYSPIRWQSGTDVMILKSTISLPISLRVDKLRTLLLLDPEFNQNNKILGRSLMRQAEAHSQIPPEQYGSRKKHRAIEAALNKVLTQRISGGRSANPALFVPTMPNPVMTGLFILLRSCECFVSVAPWDLYFPCLLRFKRCSTSSAQRLVFRQHPSQEGTFRSKALDKAMEQPPRVGQSSVLQSLTWSELQGLALLSYRLLLPL
jgi:hypothetical protein